VPKGLLKPWQKLKSQVAITKYQKCHLFSNSKLERLVINALPIFYAYFCKKKVSILYRTWCVVRRNITVLSTTRANAALTLQSYFYRTEYWAWAWIKKSNARVFGLLLFLAETNNFVAGTSSRCSSRFCRRLVVFSPVRTSQLFEHCLWWGILKRSYKRKDKLRREECQE